MWDGGHRQASILPNKKVMWLRFKIFVGYITLITLLAFTVYSFRKEQMERNRLRQDERELIHTRHLAEQIYAALLELSALGETVGEGGRPQYLSEKEQRGLPASARVETIYSFHKRTITRGFALYPAGTKRTIA